MSIKIARLPWLAGGFSLSILALKGVFNLHSLCKKIFKICSAFQKSEQNISPHGA